MAELPYPPAYGAGGEFAGGGMLVSVPLGVKVPHAQAPAPGVAAAAASARPSSGGAAGGAAAGGAAAVIAAGLSNANMV
jgi:hypothetical protein